jgi:uncharacterized protein (UPF0332 family)
MINDNVRLSMEHAERCLSSARALLEIGDYDGAVNRSYYCVFHSVRALFAIDSIEFKKHSSLIGYFREKYIKTGIFEKRLSGIIGDLFEERNDCDYDCYFVINEETVKIRIRDAEYFYGKIHEYLDKLNGG